MSTIEHRKPLGDLPVTSTANVTIDDTTLKATNKSSPSVDDLASSMAKHLHIVDDDDDFDDSHKGKLQTVDWKKENKEMDKMFESQSAQQLKNLPPFERPKGFKKSVEFFKHQEDGIRWLVQQEQNAPPNPFVRERQLKDGTVAIYDKLTRARLVEAHPPVKGAILADDMGLGTVLRRFLPQVLLHSLSCLTAVFAKSFQEKPYRRWA